MKQDRGRRRGWKRKRRKKEEEEEEEEYKDEDQDEEQNENKEQPTKNKEEQIRKRREVSTNPPISLRGRCCPVSPLLPPASSYPTTNACAPPPGLPRLDLSDLKTLRPKDLRP